MILYNTTINIDAEVHDQWLAWMKQVHIPHILATGLFVDNKILRLLTGEEGEGYTYAFQYYLRTMDDYVTYQNNYAPQLEAQVPPAFATRLVHFSTLLQVVQ